MLVAVEGIVETLRGVPPPRFQPGHICKLLHDLSVRPETLQPFLHFAPRRYTRNLIYRDDLFELLALCWDPRTASPIHNHANQLCWLAVHEGALRLENAVPAFPRAEDVVADAKAAAEFADAQNAWWGRFAHDHTIQLLDRPLTTRTGRPNL